VAALRRWKEEHEGKETSIWAMKKDQLIEVARMELGMTISAASKETVIVLRERIRSQRAMLKEVLDPHDAIPKGLEKMNLAALIQETEDRNLPIPIKPTRPRLILMIRDDVATRNTLYATQTVEAKPQSRKAGGPASTQDSDWTMEDPAARQRK
jgi:hypothetical protein